jgi:fused signal recognition particle receptor
MVFDWFRNRTKPQAEKAVEPPADEVGAPGPDSDLEDVAPAAVSPVLAAAIPEAAPAPATAGAVNQEALEWARQAYARLKAEQQAQKQAASATVETPPATPSAAAPKSESESLQPLVTAEPVVAAPPTAAVSAPEAPQAPVAPTPLPHEGPAPPAPGRSLLEQAAAQRQQRLQELTAQDTAGGSEALSPPGVLPGAGDALSGAAAPVTAGDDLQLGAFDDTFTWSAEVLAAQGRSVDQVSLEEIDWLGRLRRGLEKTRRGFVTQLLDSLGDDPLTPEVIDDLETTLLRADVGVQATDQVLAALRQRLNEEVVDPAEGLRFLKEQLRGLLEAPITASGRDLLVPERGRLNVWLLVGVNGVGKTTTLGKLANLAVRSGYSCLIAAADTFRAAAVQQVSVWGERSGVAVISNPTANADPAAVVYDAIGAAQAKGCELVLVDTAGRLQTKHNLMEELAKVRRIVDKLAPDAAVESLLVLDASQGQNGLKQAMAFAQAAGLTGVVITKLDGSARGGVALAVASEAKLPIRFIGAGETILDLRPFNSFEFVEALLAS